MNVVEKAATSLQSQCGGLRALPVAPLHREPAAPASSTPAASRSISPASPRCWRATRRRCCSAPPGPRRRNSSATSWAAAPGSPRRSASSRDELLKEIQRRLRNKPEIFEVSRAEAPCQAGGADRRRRRRDQAAGASAARRRRRALYLGVDRLCHRSEDRLHQCRAAPADAALAARDRHRSGRAERSARRSTRPTPRRASRTPVSFVVGAHPIDHVAGVMRLPVDELGIVASAARRAAAGGQMRHQRHPRAGRRRIRASRAISTSAAIVEPEGPYGEFLGYYGAVKRNPVFHVTAITRRNDALFQTSTIGGKTLGPHRHRAAFGAAHRDHDLARAAKWRCASRSRSMPRPRAAAPSTCASRSASACRARRATPSAPAWARSPIARTSSWSIPTSTSSPTSRWTGRWRRASSPTAT